MANLSRLTIDSELRAIAQLAGEAQQHRMLAARLTLNCIDGKPNKTVLKLAAEGAAARITAAQLPLFVTPDALHDGLVKLGIPADTATGVVGHLAAAMAVRDEHEQVNDQQAAELVAAELASVPSLAGLKSIYPTTSSPQPVPAEAPAPPAFELPKGTGRRPPSQRAIDEAKREHEAAVAEWRAAQAGVGAGGAPVHENPVAEGGWPDLDAPTDEES